MTKSKNLTFLKRPIFSRRVDLFVEICASLIGLVVFFISGVFMVLWGNSAGDLWPIPKEPAPLLFRIPVGIVLIVISVYWARTAMKRMYLLKGRRN